MNWIDLTSENQLGAIVEQSHLKPVVLFKHSTRCSISVAAKGRLERGWNFAEGEIDAYYLDLLNYRSVSNKIADDFAVHHESPQLLLIKNGECTYVEAHLGITVADLKEALV